MVPHFGKINVTIGRGEVVGYTMVQAGKQRLTARSGGETIDMWNYPIAVGWSGGGAGGDGGSRTRRGGTGGGDGEGVDFKVNIENYLFEARLSNAHPGKP